MSNLNLLPGDTLLAIGSTVPDTDVSDFSETGHRDSPLLPKQLIASLLRRGLPEVFRLGEVSVQGVTGRVKESKPLPDNVFNMAARFYDAPRGVYKFLV